MNCFKRLVSFVIDKRGLTLIELLAVVVILGIISSIAVLAVLGVIGDTEEEVCEANQLQLEKEYHQDLVLNEVEHSDLRFTSYLVKFGEVCPVTGDITYVDGHVECSEHGDSAEPGEDDSGDEGVPFL
ncbi:type II secretion system protein [Bacillus salacetis]|uniref:Type II secretion system protein n=1 Tax=Bacillus salacetis TaxID=2315464 RepID=A0A3A1R6Y3_9BACI|nr:type II secretion system protein [Bacillus salacetis]RIW36059.1 type II secretion system protein [Bacillus salacetis]